MKKTRLFLLLPAFLGIILYSCKSDTGSLGLDVIPPSDELQVRFDTSLVFATSTYIQDSIRSDEGVFNPYRSYSLLGSYQDPIFGLSKASCAAEIRLAKNNVNFGLAPSVDSIVLHLRLAGRHGLPQSYHQIEVYKLKDSIDIDSSYYSDLDPTLLYDPQGFLGGLNISLDRKDSLLSIRLDPSNLQELLDTANLENSSSFRKAFHGLYLTTGNSKADHAILYLNLISSQSKLSLYYRNSEEDSLRLDFPINEASARINLFQHDYQQPLKTAFADQLADTNLTIPNMYIQGMAGVRGKLKLPDLSTWNVAAGTRQVAITKAELIMKTIPRELLPAGDFSISPLRQPSSLQLAWVNTAGELKVIPDQAISSSYFGGVYNAKTQSYHFLITTMMQQLMDGDISDFSYFCIFPSDNRVSGNSVVLRGGEGPDRVKLQVSYIEL